MTKRTAPKPDAPIAADAWFVELISHAHIAAGAHMHDREIERDTWAKLAQYCATTPLKG